jgi:hypothetical protein
MKQLFKMKFIPIAFSFVILFAACKSNTKTETRDIQLLADSSAYNNNTLSDTSKLVESEPAPAKTENAATTNRSPKTQKVTTSTSGSSSTGNASTGTASNSGTSTSETTQKKKGWSKAAQGAVIGGVSGAVGGAIISKKKGTGAAIGAAVGAAGGYIIGREKDKKDGRVEK